MLQPYPSSPWLTGNHRLKVAHYLLERKEISITYSYAYDVRCNPDPSHQENADPFTVEPRCNNAETSLSPVESPRVYSCPFPCPHYSKSRAFSHARGLGFIGENPHQGEDSDDYLYTVHYTMTGSNNLVKNTWRAGKFCLFPSSTCHVWENTPSIHLAT